MEGQITEISGKMRDVQSLGRLPVCLAHARKLCLKGRGNHIAPPPPPAQLSLDLDFQHKIWEVLKSICPL